MTIYALKVALIHLPSIAAIGIQRCYEICTYFKPNKFSFLMSRATGKNESFGSDPTNQYAKTHNFSTPLICSSICLRWYCAIQLEKFDRFCKRRWMQNVFFHLYRIILMLVNCDYYNISVVSFPYCHLHWANFFHWSTKEIY